MQTSPYFIFVLAQSALPCLSATFQLHHTALCLFPDYSGCLLHVNFSMLHSHPADPSLFCQSYYDVGVGYVAVTIQIPK
jgi:hypothetical protein